MKKFTIFVFCLSFYILHSTFYIPAALATNSTPSADIKIKLEELKREIASKAATLKTAIDKKLTNKAYIGKIKTKSNTAITIASKNGPRIVNINQDTEILSQVKGKKYSQKLISEEDYIAALGDIDENQVLTAKKLILLPPPSGTHSNQLPVKTYLWGQIVSVSDNLVILKDRNLKTTSVSLPNQKAVKLSDFVILTGSLGKNNIFQAEFVYVIPKGGFIRPKKAATPSAQVATKSATQSGKKK